MIYVATLTIEEMYMNDSNKKVFLGIIVIRAFFIDFNIYNYEYKKLIGLQSIFFIK